MFFFKKTTFQRVFKLVIDKKIDTKNEIIILEYFEVNTVVFYRLK